LRPYETLLLIDARRQDAEIDETIGRFTGLVTENGGQVGNVDRWGRRRLAYEIEDQTEGYYAVVNYDLDPAKCDTVEKALPFVEGLVRSKTVRPEARTRRP
jgi:small subunit ribosomal protein S6